MFCEPPGLLSTALSTKSPVHSAETALINPTYYSLNISKQKSIYLFLINHQLITHYIKFCFFFNTHQVFTLITISSLIKQLSKHIINSIIQPLKWETRINLLYHILQFSTLTSHFFSPLSNHYLRNTTSFSYLLSSSYIQIIIIMKQKILLCKQLLINSYLSP